MKKTSVNSRKLRYGGVTAALTALIIAAVIVFNVIFSALATRFTWYIDMTPDFLYTLSDQCKSLIRDGDATFDTTSPIEMVDKIREENKAYNAEHGLTPDSKDFRDEHVMINLIFCDDADTIMDDTAQRYVYNTALELQSVFPDYIEIKNYNIYRNPSAVSKYKTTSTSTIDPTSVIIEFGTEFRVYGINAFFTFDSDTEEPWAYNGEKKFTAGILAVTRAESPIVCFTTNHGETLPDDALRTTLEDAGYIFQYIDLENEEIPDDCRLIVIFDPMEDFRVNDGQAKVDELNILDDFLDETNSLMVFIDHDSNGGKRLDRLENYLEEWGIVFDRTEDDLPYIVEESAENSMGSNRTIFANYANYGMGASIMKDMLSSSHPRHVIFPNAMSLSFATPTPFSSAHYSDSTGEYAEFDYAEYKNNGIYRAVYDMFITSKDAKAYAGGEVVESASDANPLKLMTISSERRDTQEDNDSVISEASFVIACGSTEFATQKCLGTDGYGNTELLLTLCRLIGNEPVPVGIERKPFADYTIDSITTAASTQYTVVLTIVPALLAIGSGAFVLIRRKNK